MLGVVPPWLAGEACPVSLCQRSKPKGEEEARRGKWWGKERERAMSPAHFLFLPVSLQKERDINFFFSPFIFHLTALRNPRLTKKHVHVLNLNATFASLKNATELQFSKLAFSHDETLYYLAWVENQYEGVGVITLRKRNYLGRCSKGKTS